MEGQMVEGSRITTWVKWEANVEYETEHRNDIDWLRFKEITLATAWEQIVKVKNRSKKTI